MRQPASILQDDVLTLIKKAQECRLSVDHLKGGTMDTPDTVTLTTPPEWSVDTKANTPPSRQHVVMTAFVEYSPHGLDGFEMLVDINRQLADRDLAILSHSPTAYALQAIVNRMYEVGYRQANLIDVPSGLFTHTTSLVLSKQLAGSYHGVFQFFFV